MGNSSDNRSHKKTVATLVFQNTFALLGGRGLGVVLSGAAAVMLARYLGSEQLGEYSALYAYVGLFGWLASFGFEAILTREASRERDLAGSILFTGVVLCVAFSLAAASLALVLAPLAGYRGFLRVLLVFAAVDILVLHPARLPAVVFQVDLKQWWGAGINVIRLVLWVGVVGVLALLRAPLLDVVLARMGCALVEAILLWHAAGRFLAAPRQLLTRRAAAFLRSSFPIAFSSLLAGVYLRVDQVMLHNMASDRVLGEYAAAVKVSELFEMLPLALLSSLFPLLSQAAAQEERFRHYLDRSYRYLVVFACGLCVFITLGAKTIVALMYGPEFSPAGRLLAILIWSEVSVFFGTVVAKGLVAADRQGFLVLPTAAGAVANVLLNLALIPHYGAAGAAWSTLASYSLAWMLVLLPFPQTRALIWQGLRLTIPVGLLALAVVGAVSLLPAPALLQVAAGLALYCLGVLATGVIHRQDLAYAWAAVLGSVAKPG